MISRRRFVGAAGLLVGRRSFAAASPMPEPEDDGWIISHQPDLGPFTNPKQQPVDFGIWQAADGTWQLWSCVRGTRYSGKTRVFYRWQGAKLTDPDWQPMGNGLEADTNFGETPWGLQAPYVLPVGKQYEMFYGDWQKICRATSADGKTFARQLQPNGKAGMFGIGGDEENCRDPMVIKIGGTYHCYTTAHLDQHGVVYLWTSPDLKTWAGPKKVASGGAAGDGPYAAECPFVVQRGNLFYLFRTQKYGAKAQTTVYASPDPLNFGINDDRYRLGTLPLAAPEVFEHQGQTYIASLLNTLDGIRIARLRWGSGAS